MVAWQYTFDVDSIVNAHPGMHDKQSFDPVAAAQAEDLETTTGHGRHLVNISSAY